jgi:hypothetical protein
MGNKPRAPIHPDYAPSNETKSSRERKERGSGNGEVKAMDGHLPEPLGDKIDGSVIAATWRPSLEFQVLVEPLSMAWAL